MNACDDGSELVAFPIIDTSLGMAFASLAEAGSVADVSLSSMGLKLQNVLSPIDPYIFFIDRFEIYPSENLPIRGKILSRLPQKMRIRLGCCECPRQAQSE